jgi:O-methyltransferase involved in polyketide biosynthesis
VAVDVPRSDDDSWEITESVGATAVRVAAARAAGGPRFAAGTYSRDLTVAGSRAAVEALSPDFLDPDVRAKRRERMDRIRALIAKADPQRELLRNDELWYFEEREDVGAWFGRHGWDVTVTPSFELMASYDRRPAKEVQDTTPHNLFVAAQRTCHAATHYVTPR